MIYKTHLAYLAEEYKLPYKHFSFFCFEYEPDKVWKMFDGNIEYCRTEDAEYLVKKYREVMNHV